MSDVVGGALIAGALRRQTQPFTPLSHIGGPGAVVDPGEDVVIAAASPGRVKITLAHDGDDGRFYVAVGQTAQPNVGEFIDPGGSWSEYVTGAVHVWLVGTTSPQQLVGTEYAA